MFLLRHGQSYFNLLFNQTRVDPGIEDPELTPLGKEQAAAAAVQLSGAALTRVIISPFTRALQTAQPVLAVHRVPVKIMHEVREQAAFACDIGSAPEVLARRFPHHEFGHLPPMWWHSGIESARETSERAEAFRVLMAACKDSATTLLVGHWAFIQALTGVSLANGEILEYDPGRLLTGSLLTGSLPAKSPSGGVDDRTRSPTPARGAESAARDCDGN